MGECLPCTLAGCTAGYSPCRVPLLHGGKSQNLPERRGQESQCLQNSKPEGAGKWGDPTGNTHGLGHLPPAGLFGNQPLSSRMHRVGGSKSPRGPWHLESYQLPDYTTAGRHCSPPPPILLCWHYPSTPCRRQLVPGKRQDALQSIPKGNSSPPQKKMAGRFRRGWKLLLLQGSSSLSTSTRSQHSL